MDPIQIVTDVQLGPDGVLKVTYADLASLLSGLVLASDDYEDEYEDPDD